MNGWLEELAKELREKTYQSRGGAPGLDTQTRQRPSRGLWAFPASRIGSAQMAAVLVLEPIFEADLPDEQYGYRRGRSAHDAIRTIHGLLNQGHREVVDCDLSGYFDSIPHHELDEERGASRERRSDARTHQGVAANGRGGG
ncbi:MAG: reverse transcriptase domain-containing protein [Verrucomicrobiota bacterium]